MLENLLTISIFIIGLKFLNYFILIYFIIIKIKKNKNL